jgi:hypothetical protein
MTSAIAEEKRREIFGGIRFGGGLVSLLRSGRRIGTNKVRLTLKAGANDLSVRSISMTLETLVLEIDKSLISRF